MDNRLGRRVIVLAMSIVAGCEATAVQSSGGYRSLTAAEMDQITLGSAGAINDAEAHAFGFGSQVFASTSAPVSSGNSPIAGPLFPPGKDAGSLVLVDNLASRRPQCVKLEGKGLIVSRYPRIADFHSGNFALPFRIGPEALISKA